MGLLREVLLAYYRHWTFQMNFPIGDAGFHRLCRRLGSISLMGAFHRACALLLILVFTTASCAPNYAAIYPHLSMLRVCMRPSTVEFDAREWAVDTDTGTTVSSNRREAFEEFLPHADVLYIWDFNAPAESAQLLPEGEARPSCDDPHRLLPRAQYDEADLPSGDSNPLRIVGDFGPHTTFVDAISTNPQYVAIDVKAPVRKIPVIHVCVKPPGIDQETLQWAATKSQEGTTYTTSIEQFNKAIATADRIFVYDDNAPPESVYEFGPPYDQLRCKGKPPPKPREPEKELAKRKATFEEMVRDAMAQKKGDHNHEGLGGSPEPTWSSSATGTGQSLSFFEAIVRQTLIAQGVLSGDTSGNLKDPNGQRYGIPSGKNPNGPNSFFLQFMASTFMFLPKAVKSGTELAKKIAAAAKKNAILIIARPDFLPKPIVQGLVKRYGDQMAVALAQMQTIMPYSRASMFTARWRYLYQSHHILEKDMADKVLNIANGDDIPAIILTDLKHKAITAALDTERKNILRKAGKNIDDKLSPDELWRLYQNVYGLDHPVWLESIRSYFGK